MHVKHFNVTITTRKPITLGLTPWRAVPTWTSYTLTAWLKSPERIWYTPASPPNGMASYIAAGPDTKEDSLSTKNCHFRTAKAQHWKPAGMVVSMGGGYTSHNHGAQLDRRILKNCTYSCFSVLQPSYSGVKSDENRCHILANHKIKLSLLFTIRRLNTPSVALAASQRKGGKVWFLLTLASLLSSVSDSSWGWVRTGYAEGSSSIESVHAAQWVVIWCFNGWFLLNFS